MFVFWRPIAAHVIIDAWYIVHCGSFWWISPISPSDSVVESYPTQRPISTKHGSHILVQLSHQTWIKRNFLIYVPMMTAEPSFLDPWPFSIHWTPGDWYRL